MRRYFAIYVHSNRAYLGYKDPNDDAIMVYTKVDTMEDARDLARLLNEKEEEYNE